MKTNLILEIGYNHNGSVDQAKRLIDRAYQLHVFGIKFQKWEVDAFPNIIKNAPYKNTKNSFGTSYYEHRKALEFDIEVLQELKSYAESGGLSFICSGKDLQSVQKLLDIGCYFIKIPSQRLLNQEIFNILQKADCIKMVSTGMHTEEEILNSPWYEVADIFFHCISVYPTPLKNCDLGFMKRISAYNGYSSHEFEGRAIKYFVASGCNYIERHFTLDKNDRGSDHCISSDITEIKRIQLEIEEAESILGDNNRNVTESELNCKEYYGSF